MRRVVKTSAPKIPANTKSRVQTWVLAGVVAASFVATGCEPESVVRPGLAPQTSRMGISSDGRLLYVALADHDEVRAIDPATGDTKQVVSVVGHPHRLTVLKDGKLAVTARYAGTVSIVDMDKGVVEATVEVGSDPFGVVEVGNEIVVAVAGESDLAVLRDGRIDRRIVLDSDDPRGLAVTGDKLIVSHFSAGKLSVVNVESGVATAQVGMKLRSRTFFTPNQIDQLTVDPSDPSVVVAPHVECNNDPAQFGAGSTAFVGVSAAQYYNSGPTGFPAVVPSVSRADVDNEVIISDDNDDAAQAGFGPEPTGGVTPLMNPLNRTLLGSELINAPTAVALADDGNLELVVALGSGNVVVRRSVLRDGQDSIIGTVDVGVGAEAIVLSPDGDTAYVFNGFDQSISKFAVPLTARAETRFADAEPKAAAATGAFGAERNRPMREFDVERMVIADQALPADVVLGRALFHAVDQRLTQNGAISCASCHPGGGDDGTTWSFAEGPRQSPALWGGIIGTEPFHWDQAVVDMADISRVTVIGRMGGSGLGRSDMNAIGAFLDQLPIPAAPTTTNVSNESLSRGADLFVAKGCTECHAGADFTDGRAHNVGTGRLATQRESMDAFATPPLKGLAQSGPWLHDGSAKTLRETVTKLVITNKMVGAGVDASTMTEQDIDDLTAYLASM